MGLDGSGAIHGSLLSVASYFTTFEVTALHFLDDHRLGHLALCSDGDIELAAVHKTSRCVHTGLRSDGENTDDVVHCTGNIHLVCLLVGNPQHDAHYRRYVDSTNLACLSSFIIISSH